MFTFILIAMLLSPPDLLFDFSPEFDLSTWQVVDDVVMGGRSDGHFALSAEGHALYTGKVSLENNGGFSSVRSRFGPLDASSYSSFQFRVKGDGKRYQFRVKTSGNDYHSYVSYFQTSAGDEWQTITIPFAAMKPQFRGRSLDLPNYPGQAMSEIAFLIGNKEAETFRLEIDWIGLVVTSED